MLYIQCQRIPEEDQVFSVEMENSTKQLQAAGILISQSQETIAGFNAIELVYTDKPTSPKIKQLHYFIDGGNVWYQLLFTAKQEKFNEYGSSTGKRIDIRW